MHHEAGTVGKPKRRTKSIHQQKPTRSREEILNDHQSLGTAERTAELIESLEQVPTVVANAAAPIGLMTVASQTFAQSNIQLSQIRAFTLDLVSKTHGLPSQPISLHIIGDDKYTRTSDFSSRHADKSIQDLSMQLTSGSNAGVINPPLLFKNLQGDVRCISGQKRIAALRNSGATQVVCLELTP